MDKIYDKCCGIDVHKKLIVACFRCGKKQEVREFGATTRELLELADWLKDEMCIRDRVLPLGPTGFGDSPYQGFSAFAGQPLIISPDLDVYKRQPHPSV